MKYYTEKLTIEDIRDIENKIIIKYRLDSHNFKTELQYEDINFDELKKKYGIDFINSVIFHIAFLEGIKFCSLVPRYYLVGRYSKYFNYDLINLFKILYNKIFAQHKYENNLGWYHGPEIVIDKGPLGRVLKRSKISDKKIKLLLSCGGGKDSLVSMKLLERAKIPFSVFQYSHSVYGDKKKQHKLIDNLVNIFYIEQHHKVSIIEDFFSRNVLKNSFSDIKTLCIPETPNGVFQAIPFMLKYGYIHLSIGHEKSANSGNFYWKKISDEVNHQWGKSYEAEKILNKYIQKNLLSNFNFFSILQPIYDFLIFQLLKKDSKNIHLTHSCNVKKPWCKRCPKCAYVWLNFMAYLEKDLVDSIFKENLLDVKELTGTYLQMLGLEGHKPFECIGEIGEARLAMHYCMKKGLKGQTMDIFKDKILNKEDFNKLMKKYNHVYSTDHSIPKYTFHRILPLLKKAQTKNHFR